MENRDVRAGSGGGAGLYSSWLAFNNLGCIPMYIRPSICSEIRPCASGNWLAAMYVSQRVRTYVHRDTTEVEWRIPRDRLPPTPSARSPQERAVRGVVLTSAPTFLERSYAVCYVVEGTWDNEAVPVGRIAAASSVGYILDYFNLNHTP